MTSTLDELVTDVQRLPPGKRPSESKATIWDGTDAPVKFKVLMIGASNVGKTSLAHYFVHGQSRIDQVPTHGAKYDQVAWKLHSKPITLELWDTAGQDRQMTTLAPFVRGADAVLLVFDCTSLASIQDLERRFTMLMPSLRVRNPPVVFLLANKADRALVELGEVWGAPSEPSDEADEKTLKSTKEELETALDALVQSVHQQLFKAVSDLGGEAEQGLVSCYTCSAKTGLNCKEIVEQLQLRIAFRQLYLSRTAREERKSVAKIVKLDAPNPNAQVDKPCCI